MERRASNSSAENVVLGSHLSKDEGAPVCYFESDRQLPLAIRSTGTESCWHVGSKTVLGKFLAHPTAGAASDTIHRTKVACRFGPSAKDGGRKVAITINAETRYWMRQCQLWRLAAGAGIRTPRHRAKAGSNLRIPEDEESASLRLSLRPTVQSTPESRRCSTGSTQRRSSFAT